MKSDKYWKELVSLHSLGEILTELKKPNVEYVKVFLVGGNLDMEILLNQGIADNQKDGSNG